MARGTSAARKDAAAGEESAARQAGAAALPEPAAPRAGAGAVHRLVVGERDGGERLDRYLAAQLAGISRARIQRWIEDDAVRLNDGPARSRAIVQPGDRIVVREQTLPQAAAYEPEPVAFAIVWEDESIIVVNKPAGLVVHPGAGNWHGTLLNGLLHHDPSLLQVPRAGIVHRLDAGTSGLMVVARTPAAHLDLVRQLAQRTVVREYWALAAGEVAPSVTIDAPIDRDPRNPLRFRVSRSASARPARTYVRRLALWNAAPAQEPALPVSWIVCRLDTGRTHQIRVHLESIGHPLLGDPVYRRHLPARLAAQRRLDRPALHACRLELVHPSSGETMGWSAAPPDDMKDCMRKLGAQPRQLRAPARLSIPLPAAASGAKAPPARGVLEAGAEEEEEDEE
jgi:23S rRNA pseudouridine1911/1915/1917 synthase